MKNADSSIALMRVVSVSALMLLAGGCEQPMQVSGAGDVDEIPLLVPINKDNCPIDVIQVVESCDAAHQAKGTACRKKNAKIIWLAVSGESPPYQRDENLPVFHIVFKNSNYDPIEKPGSGGGACKDSRDGVLDCKIRHNAPTGTYEYSVFAGGCSLDPRIYVP